MTVEISDIELDYEISEQSCLSILILPSADHNNKIIYPETSLAVQKILRQNNIASNLALEQPNEVAFLHNRSSDWFGPTLFFSASLLSQNPDIISICINLISSYIYDVFKHTYNDPNIKISVVINKNGIKKIDYDGPISGLNAIEKIIKNGK